MKPQNLPWNGAVVFTVVTSDPSNQFCPLTSG